MAFLLFETIIYCRLKGKTYASKQYTYTHKTGVLLKMKSTLQHKKDEFKRN